MAQLEREHQEAHQDMQKKVKEAANAKQEAPIRSFQVLSGTATTYETS